MIDTVNRFIEKENLLPRNALVIVGLSGGMDSMALLDLLTLLGYQCVAAHCNFHLRGEESNRDAAFVKKWCKQIDIPFVSIDFDTKQYAFDRKISIEMAARELRYDWFEIICKQYNAAAIAVAHHKDDSVETVLLNLCRGTGIKGMTGIMPKNKNIVRPLLCVSRCEIEAYITEREIPWVFDSTNNEDVHLRNYLRLTIIPQLERLNPSVKEAIWRTSRNLCEVEKVYNYSVRKEMARLFNEGKIDIKLLKKTASPQSVLFEILSPYGFSVSVIEDAFRGMDASSGKIFYSKSHRLIKDREYFILDENIKYANAIGPVFIEKGMAEIDAPIGLKIRLEKMPVSISKSKYILYADASLLEFPLVLRRWEEGDWFVPFGMKGRKKISDYFTDKKYSLDEKENAWLLLSGGKIVWIVGERSDERFKVTKETQHVLIIEAETK